MGSTSIPVDGVASTADVQSSPSGQNTFEAFVKSAVQKIQREAWGRSSEVVEIRNACQTFLDQLNSEAGGATLGVPFNEQRTRAALKPLQLACASSSARIVEPALGCLHKLVAYAWIQGESSENGNMDDGSLVTEIVTMVVKCIQLGNASVYLAVIRALLTFATADHFVAHGHCLLHMVRTVFNLAVSCEESNLKRTACNALLQMLNTVVKRVVVTQFQMRTHHSTNSMDSTQDLAVRGPIREDILEETATATEGESEPGETPNAENQTNMSGTWKLADLAEKEDIEALEAAFEDKQRVMEEESIEKPGAPEPPKPDQSQIPESSAVAKTAAVQEKEPSQDVSSPAEKMAKRPKGWDQLTLLEKDVLVVLMAFCKLAGVNTSSVTSENYVRHGKLLALELLVKVFENPGHRWENVRLAFCEQLRFPLCLVLIRNCNPAEAKAFQFAIRLFVSVMMQLQIRLGLKAELGALYPLLLLRPLESSTLDPSLLTVTLTGVKRISKEPQMQVDIFINYDCNLKAPNLYERTARALSQLAVNGDPAAPASQSALLREAAAACAMAMLASLDAWAGPVRDATHVGDALSPDAGPKGSANGSSSVIGPTSEVRHFGEAKERKNSLSVGIELFNKSPAKGIASLVASGVVLNKADTIASFLRKNREQLDSAMMGEYLGLNDEMPLKVMHAYIDMEDYQGITIDIALRKLLSQFRLPGEAQKIDRIMEKFAERYCQDNPNVFESADDAYVLSFSIIMLNTDIHNPMAEKRLGKQDFVSMNMRQRSEGVYVEVLPVADLEAIYDRIATEEIRALHSSPGPTTKQEVMAQHRNLASAVGLTQLAFPFRSGRVWDKARGAQIEHEHLLALTQKAMRSGAVEAELWFTATHTEHARPMLDVAGPHFQKALAAAVESASDKESADRSVNSLVMAAQLAALLGLDSLCQHFVSTLAHAIGVHSKEAFLRANPHRQISALRALIGVASDEQAGLLGGSWTTILRTISSVEALIADMRRGHKSSHSVFEESMQTAKVQQPSEKKDLDKSTAIGRFFTQLGLTKGEVEVYSAVQPGQAIRVWSGGEGITEMDRIFVRSASLDGEAVVIFCRALCAVSHEELNPATPHPEGASPRVFSLRKLVECAYYNLGRIRLIWGRLWSTISMHLVSASCHSDQTVAMYSVDSLRQLVGKLLSRDELVNFTTQSDTLRPFVTVLKQCANVVVRELAVQCIEQAMNTHSSRLGSGWMVILEFLSVASLDPAPSVTRQCIDALQSVVNVHWRKWGRGRDALADCVKVALRVARNPHNSDCSLRAIRLIHLCAKELVNELTATERNEGWRSASVDWTETEREENVDMHRTASVPQGAAEVPPAKEVVIHADPLLSPSALWTVIFEALVEVINREDRRRCADTAAEIFFSLPSPEFSATWDQRTWAVFQSALHRIFDLSENAYSMESGIDRILSYSTTFFPGLFSVVTANYKTDGKSLLAHMLEILMGWMMSPRQVLAVSGVYLLQDMVFDVADVLDEEGWSVAVGRLQCTWNVCASDGMSADGSRRVPFLSWIEGETPLDTATIRIRCQVLATLQRIIYRILEELNEKVPANLIPKLIEILLNAVTHTAEANNDSEFLEKLHQHLSTCASQVSTPPSHGSDAEMVQRNEAPVAGGITAAIVESPVEEEAAESEETDSESDDNKSENELEQQDRARATEEAESERKKSETEEGEESAKEGPSVLPALKTEFSQTAPIPTPSSTAASAASAAVAAAAADVTRSEMYDQPASLPELSASLLQARHEMFSGFLKMYVEGGILTIQALLDHQQRMEAAEEATEQLLAFCRGLIHQASTETKALIAKTKDTNEMGAIQSQWKQAVKAPLIAKALEAYKDIKGEVLATELKALVPHLSTLICNPQPMIRQAVAQFMKDKTSAVLSLKPL